MTEEQIDRAAEEYTDQFVPESIKSYTKYYKYCGAEWALEHQWIDVNKSLPEYEEDVIVTTDGKDCWFTHRSNNPDVMRESHGFVVYGWEEVRYWMPIPKLKVK